ncbi:MAG: hypothetical protein LBN04_02220 [Oscillospiraceae bacterium]|jgi:uncharacterized protein YuzE|nr:hypothetical protein [Oscillospiraceae bacterium]
MFKFNWLFVSGGAPYISLTSLGISFNSISIEKLGNPDKVIVGFDEERCAIGVKAYQGEAGVKPYEFASRVRNGWIRIGCRDFIRYLQNLTGIDFSEAKRYIAEYDAETDALVIYVRGAYEGEKEGNTDESH